VSSAYKTALGWQSRCKRCRAHLVRFGPSNWREIGELERAA
jgi:hypothetical protein